MTLDDGPCKDDEGRMQDAELKWLVKRLLELAEENDALRKHVDPGHKARTRKQVIEAWERDPAPPAIGRFLGALK